ncbi:hypothetical protein EBR04_07065 [bacterium]|nr:hypothetical protein [bacterium]
MTKRQRLPINGWLIIDKPEGMGSTNVVGLVKRLTNAAKVGHAGTLDPFASGVLPIALGEATKTIQFATDAEKTYRFTLTFGTRTDTDDREGDEPRLRERGRTRAGRHQAASPDQSSAASRSPVPGAAASAAVTVRTRYSRSRRRQSSTRSVVAAAVGAASTIRSTRRRTSCNASR